MFRELLIHSNFHIVVVEDDSEKVQSLRNELVEAGMYGSRSAVIEADPALFTVQPYLFSMVLSENAIEAGLINDDNILAAILDRLRPYGGIAWLGVNEGWENNLQVEVDKVSFELIDNHIFATRSGPLTGAGEWTHQYHDPANTLLSQDELVKLPLGVLWFGGPNNHDILPRHSGGPKPQVAGGRQVFLGVETMSARCVYTGRELWQREFSGIGHPFTNMTLEERWADGREVYMNNIPGATYIGSPFVTLPDSIYLRYEGSIYRLDPVTGETIDKFSLPGKTVEELYGENSPDWGHISVQGDYLITTNEPDIFENQSLGWTNSYSGTSSNRLIVMDRYSGDVIWQRESRIGFRHMAIISSNNTLYVIDGVSANVVEHIERRGFGDEEASIILGVVEKPEFMVLALDLTSGAEIWRSNSEVFGTYLLYSQEHDILVEGGSRDLRHRLIDEPVSVIARQGSDGEVIWQSGNFLLPGALRGEMLIPGRPGNAISILTGDTWQREQPYTDYSSNWRYSRTYGCNTLNASVNLLLFRTGYAGFYDLEHDSGTGNFSGFRSGCTANMIAADGVLNALDYTRTCTCSYAHQTSLALVHMPGDTNIEFWTRYDADPANPAGHGINFGAPGRRVDENSLVWHDMSGTHRRHASAIKDNGGGIEWVLSSARESSNNETITINDVISTQYTVRLHFAELNNQVEAGQRVFDVLINGEPKETGFDIVAETGGVFKGKVLEFTIDNSDMAMTIELQRQGSQFGPMINGIELIATNL